MKRCRPFAAAVILGFALLVVAGKVDAAPITTCVVPTSVTLNVLPSGCTAVLTNGPITFTGVHGLNGDSHNFEIDSLLLSDMNIATTSARVVMQGVDRDVTAGTITPFNYTLPSINFETSPTNNAYLPDTGEHVFGIQHFIVQFPDGTFKLNFGESGRPSQDAFQLVRSSADTTTTPGYFTVSSFFDIFTELSLDGGFNNGTWTVADNDFVGEGTGSGSILQFQGVQSVPEPTSLLLLGSGLATLARRRFRRR
jgi:hypothetical protein